MNPSLSCPYSYVFVIEQKTFQSFQVGGECRELDKQCLKSPSLASGSTSGLQQQHQNPVEGGLEMGNQRGNAVPRLACKFLIRIF
jgi:hypothetical protein